MKRFYRIFYTTMPLLISLVVGWTLSKQQKEIYDIYILPAGMPPSWLFIIVWSILYVLLGYSLYRIYAAPRSGDTILAGVVLIGQMILQFVWNYVFFLFHLLFYAVLLQIFIIVIACWNYGLIHRFDRKIAYMHLPYLLWLLFALYLSWSMYLFN